MRNIFIFVLAMLILGCSGENVENFKPYKTGDIIELKGVAGGKIELVRAENGFKIKDSDKILMIDIFGTYCPPCQKEAPHLSDFQLKNSKDFQLVGLTHFENVSDSYVVENFSKKYNGYYFISNSKENARLIDQILADIKYQYALQIPLKVVLKDGVYQNLTNRLEDSGIAKFYLGDIKISLMQDDLNRIKNGN